MLSDATPNRRAFEAFVGPSGAARYRLNAEAAA